jgi:predicted permease
LEINATALAAAVLVTALTIVVSGVAPAVFAWRVDAGESLRSGAKLSMSGHARLAGEAMAATQVGLAVVALFVAALVARSFFNLQATDLRFDADQLLTAELAIPADILTNKAAHEDLLTRLEERLTSIPGVRRVAPVLSVPFIGSGGGIDGRLALPGQSAEERQRSPIVNMEIITPTYFATLGTPLVRGRSFTDADRQGGLGVVIVSASTARSLWPGDDAIGKRVELGRDRTFTVVGIVPDTRYRDLRSDRLSVYFPLAQSFFPVAPTRLLVRTDRLTSPAALIRRAVAEVDPDVTVANVATLAEHLIGPHAQPRLNAMVLGTFAATSVVLAAIGLFSVMATMVRRRTREIGIRMAVGATRVVVGRLVLVRGITIAAAGMALGIISARVIGPVIADLLYEIEPTDPLTTTGVAVAVLCVAVLATLFPARNAARVEPNVALSADL